MLNWSGANYFDDVCACPQVVSDDFEYSAEVELMN
jgi:hypothetical protein